MFIFGFRTKPNDPGSFHCSWTLWRNPKGWWVSVKAAWVSSCHLPADELLFLWLWGVYSAYSCWQVSQRGDPKATVSVFFLSRANPVCKGAKFNGETDWWEFFKSILQTLNQQWNDYILRGQKSKCSVTSVWIYLDKVIQSGWSEVLTLMNPPGKGWGVSSYLLQGFSWIKQKVLIIWQKTLNWAATAGCRWRAESKV